MEPSVKVPVVSSVIMLMMLYTIMFYRLLISGGGSIRIIQCYEHGSVLKHYY